jgi:hypothetical protein
MLQTLLLFCQGFRQICTKLYIHPSLLPFIQCPPPKKSARSIKRSASTPHLRELSLSRTSVYQIADSQEACLLCVASSGAVIVCWIRCGILAHRHSRDRVPMSPFGRGNRAYQSRQTSVLS